VRSRGGCFLFFVVIALLWGGGQSLYTALLNRTPTVVSISEYGKNRPKAHWLRLTDCRLSLADSLYRKKYSSIDELYIPLRASRDAGPIHVLLATKDAGLLAAFQELQACKSAEEVVKVYAKHNDKLTQRQSVQGLIRFGIDLKDKDWNKLASLEKSLAPDFVLLDEGKEPSLGLGIGLLIPGLLLGAFVGARAARSS